MNYNYNINFIKFFYNYDMDFIKQSSNYLFRANNKNTRASFEICSQLAIKILEQWEYCSNDITVNFKYIAQIRQVSLLLTLNK